MRLIAFGDPDQDRLEEVVRGASRADVTYASVGSTLAPAFDGYARTVELGPGTFEAAVEGLRSWVCHPGIGASVYPQHAPIALGATVLVLLRLGPIRLIVPDRIVAVVDEPDCFGFAYGTLPGHPERGEEAFIVERLEDGRTTATIRVIAEGAWLIARIGGPLVRRLQRLALHRYLAALQRHCDDSTEGKS